jgi:hypothetical protein
MRLTLAEWLILAGGTNLVWLLKAWSRNLGQVAA